VQWIVQRVFKVVMRRAGSVLTPRSTRVWAELIRKRVGIHPAYVLKYHQQIALAAGELFRTDGLLATTRR
jgi:hypothetical protein